MENTQNIYGIYIYIYIFVARNSKIVHENCFLCALFMCAHFSCVKEFNLTTDRRQKALRCRFVNGLHLNRDDHDVAFWKYVTRRAFRSGTMSRKGLKIKGI